MSTAFVWLQFLACAGLIALAGPQLTRYGEVIARLTGLSRSWIGLILLATATSLPELFTGASAVAIAAAPDIALGDALGSCVFNLAMLIVLDALSRDEPVYRRLDQGHILTAGFGVILIGAVGALLILGRDGSTWRIGHVGAATPVLILLYFVAVRAAFVYERRRPPGPEGPGGRPAITLRRAVLRYLAAACVIVAAGTWLPFIGIALAQAMGWHTTFVGTLFVAAATSLPELTVTIAALRLGMPDMAVANLLGSNLFDVLVIAIDDLFYLPGPLLAAVAPAHAVSAFAALVMTGIFIVALLYRPENRLFRTVGWVSLALLLVYLLSAYAVYLQGH